VRCGVSRLHLARWVHITDGAGCIDRIDATVDIMAAIDSLLFWHPGIAKTQAYWKSGKTETIYLGSATSPKQICVYDKVAEIRHHNAKTWVHVALPSTHHPGRGADKDPTPCNKWQATPNPFALLHVASLAAFTGKEEDLMFRLFLKQPGYERSGDLLSLSEAHRKRFRRRLEMDWSSVDPTTIWSQWPSVVIS